MRARGRIFIWAILGTSACGDLSKNFEVTALKHQHKTKSMCSGSVKIGTNVLVNGRETCDYIDPRTQRKTTATAQREPAIAGGPGDIGSAIAAHAFDREPLERRPPVGGIPLLP